MIISNAKIFFKDRFITGAIEFDNKIQAIHIDPPFEGDINVGGNYVIPGLIDIHSHGAVNEDASDGSPEGLFIMSRYYASVGVTSWCPTTMTLNEDRLTSAMKTISAFSRPYDGAKLAGINMEGPFLSSAKKGAQNEEYLHKPDVEMFKRLYSASGNNIRIVSVAPEEEGAMEFISEVSKYATVSIAHTSADYDTAARAYKAGASHTTHLFNAMPGIHHRNPGVIPAASDFGATVELITDGIHINPAVIRMTDRLFGDRLVLISDSLRCAGMPDGNYSLGGQQIILRDKKATIAGTDTIAGSSINLMDGLRNAVKFGVSLENAVSAASSTPAKVIGRFDEIGSLEKGKAADFVILDEKLNILNVYIDGGRIY